MADGGGLFPAVQAGEQLRHGGMEGRDLIGTADLGLGAEIPQGTGGLHQRAAEEAAARLVGGEDHVPGHILGVELAHAGDDARADTVGEQVCAAAQAGEHTVIGHIAAALVQRHSEQQAAAGQILQPVIGVAELAARGQQGHQQVPQGGAAVVFGEQNGEHGGYLRFRYSMAFSFARVSSRRFCRAGGRVSGSVSMPAGVRRLRHPMNTWPS